VQHRLHLNSGVEALSGLKIIYRSGVQFILITSIPCLPSPGDLLLNLCVLLVKTLPFPKKYNVKTSNEAIPTKMQRQNIKRSQTLKNKV
jgi:hypothetical protein